MSEIKVGDRVRRIAGDHLGMQIGDEGTVKAVIGTNVVLNEYQDQHHSGTHVARNLQVLPATQPVVPAARKDDSGKLDMNLLDDMPRAVKALVEVMQWAIEKKQPVPYVRGSWLGVSADRYRAAIKRHDRAACAQATSESPARFQLDPETSLLHLAHQACSAMMALENTLRELESKQ